MVEAVAGRSWGRVAPLVADPSAFRFSSLLLVPFEVPYAYSGLLFLHHATLEKSDTLDFAFSFAEYTA